MKIAFVDFWPNFNVNCNFFTGLLEAAGMAYVISWDGPDLLFYSCFGEENRHYPQARKIFFLGENRPLTPTQQTADVVLSHLRRSDAPYFRLPLWVIFIDWFHLGRAPRDPVGIPPESLQCQYADQRPKFCAFMVNNGTCAQRNQIFADLSQYQRVESLGSWSNNVGVLGGDFLDKFMALKAYKFNLCYENSSAPGYITEKLVHAKLAGCIPIYWGADDVVTEFNPEGFINANNFSNNAELIQYIQSIDQDQEKYEAMRRVPLIDDSTPWNDIPLYFHRLIESIRGTAQSRPEAEPPRGTAQSRPEAEPPRGTAQSRPETEPPRGTAQSRPETEPPRGTAQSRPEALPPRGGLLG